MDLDHKITQNIHIKIFLMRGQTLLSVASISKDVLVLVYKKIPCGHALTGRGRNEPISRIKLNPDQHYKR